MARGARPAMNSPEARPRRGDLCFAAGVAAQLTLPAALLMRVSVVIPAFNEEGNIGRLIEETFAKVPVDALGEVLAVDDGSDDGTGAEIKALLSKYKALRYLRHGRRSGQSAALRTGVAAARFPVIATMGAFEVPVAFI